MAQRRRAAGTFACGLFLRMSLLLPLRSPFAGQPKEDQAVPASAGDGNGNRAERGIVPVLKPEPLARTSTKMVRPFHFRLSNVPGRGKRLSGGRRFPSPGVVRTG